MNPRVDYEMSEDDLKELLDACKPTPVLYLSGGRPFGNSPQENANDAWAKLGKKMGFDSMTVRPSNKGQRFFTAVPSETERQRKDRERQETEVKEREEIKALQRIINDAQERLNILLAKYESKA